VQIGIVSHFVETGRDPSLNKDHIPKKFLHQPTTVRWTAVKRILRYLRSTLEMVLRLISVVLLLLALSLIQIGQDILMIVDPLVALLFSWV
jgi:hypothetical protein